MDQPNNDSQAAGVVVEAGRELMVPANLQEELYQITQGRTACEAALQAAAQAAMSAHCETSLALNHRLAAVFDTLAAGQTDKPNLEQLLQSGRDIQINRDSEHSCYTATLRTALTQPSYDGTASPIH